MNNKEVLESIQILENATNFLTLTRQEHINLLEHINKIKAFINDKHTKK